MKMKFYSVRKMLLPFLMLFALVDVQAQLLTIPTGNTQGTTGTRRPYGCFFGYERTALIYLQSEINTSGNVTSVAFYVDAVNNPAASTPINIYMKTTTVNDFGTGTTLATEFTGATLVYTGTVTSAELVTGQWVTKTLTNSFMYNNTSNLEVLVEVNYGGGGGESSSAAKTFRVGNSTGSVTRFEYWFDDNTPADPTDGAITSSNRPNVQLNLTPLVACSGQPTAGNTVASAGSVCHTDNLNLSISGINNTSGISYQWISSTDGVNYTNIANATLPTYSTNQTAATYYRNIVTCANGGLKDTSTAVFVAQTVCYCEPTAGCGSSDRIDTVIFAGINNYTGCSGANAFAFYSTPVAQVVAGSSYPIRVWVANGGQENVGIWVDLNQNGIFETGEYTDLGTQVGGASFSGSIAIPGNASLGTTRMRVRAKYANNTPLTSADACLSYTYGETEDYLVNITSSNSCSGRPTAGNTLASANPVCNIDNLTLTISGNNNTAGITYQWQSSADGVAYSNINNATSAGYTTTQATATYYRNIVACSNSGLKDTSVALLVNQNICYCTVSSDCSVSDEIDTVIFAGINNYTTCSGNGYSYYPTPVAQVQRGTAVPISVYVTDGGQENVGVWIDYNQSGTFDAAEFTDLGTQPNGDVFFNGSINIPLNAALGITRMRIRDRFGDTVLTNADACYIYGYGETEDYLVNITAAPACTTPSVGGTASGPAAGQLDSVITFTLTGSTGNIQWQFSTSSANGPFYDFPGYTQSTIQIAFNGLATFYVRAYVTSPGCTPDSSNVISIVITKRGNDVCDAIPLNFGVNGPFSTVGATIQAGEPAVPATGCETQTGWCADSAITNTMWFKFVAPASGRISIQSPDFDTQLALWDATNCASILTGGATLVKANDDDTNYLSHNGELGSSFIDSAICLTPGKTYYVQLDAFDSPGDVTDIILTDLGAGPNASFTNLAAGYCVSAPPVTLTPSVAGGTFSGPGISGNTFTAATAGLGGPYVITYSLYACYSSSDTVTVNNGPAITPAVTPVRCFGGNTGAINVTVTNGTGNYTYGWSNQQTTQNISGLTAGNYTLTLTDNTSGCTATSGAITVTQPTAIVPSLDSIVNVKCNGASTGGVYVSITGGTTPYIYQWSNNTSNQDLTNAPAGSYTATVTDANSCQLSTPQPFVITQSTAIVITVDSTDENVCGANNGAIYISVTGGTPGPDYTYLWSNQQTTQDITGLSTTTYTVVVTDDNSCTASGQATVVDDTPLSLTVLITPDSCGSASTGAINITVTGGSGSYTYSWSSLQSTEDITALSEGSYTVSVDDNNSTCSVTNTYFVGNTLPPTVTFNVGNVSCFGANDGFINATASGGSAPYTFGWSPNVPNTPVNLSGDTYSVTVTDNLGCTATYSVTLLEPSALAISIDLANVRCFGESTGAVAVIPSGGTKPYQYLWSNNQTDSNLINLPAGKYVFEVSDSNGCQLIDSVTITQGPQIIATVDSVINVTCFGNSTGAIYTTLSGGTGGLVIDWSTTPPSTTPDVTGLAAGSYTATVSDANGCSANVSRTVSGPASALSATSVSTDQTSGSNNGAINLTITGGSAPYTTQWSNNAITEDLSNLAAGTYTVLITDTNGCTFSLTDTVKLNTGVGIAGLQNSFDVNLYPNPTQDKVFIELNLATAANVTVQVYSIEGRLINEFTDRNILTTRYEMSFATEAAGIYMAKIKAGDTTITKRFTVAK